MIDQALNLLKNELNGYISLKTEGANIGKVFLKPLLKQDGSLLMENDSLSLILVNVEEEYAAKDNEAFLKTSDKNVELINPAINLNLLILIVANFNNYDEALKFLSLAISFFQSKSMFNGENSPSFDQISIDELSIKLVTLSLEQQNHIWGTLGAKYMPSTMFKVSLIRVQEKDMISTIPVIESVESSLNKI